MLGAKGEHHEPDRLFVGHHTSQPWDDRSTVDYLREQGINESLGHRGHEPFLGLVGPQLGKRRDVIGGHLNQAHLGGPMPRTVSPPLPVGPGHSVNPVVRHFVSKPKRRTGVALEEEAAPLQNHGRGRIIGVEHSADPGHVDRIEQILDHCRQGFSGIAPAPVLFGEGVADFGGPSLP